MMSNSEENNMSKLPNRRPCVTTDVGEGLAVTVSYNMGVEASKLMQNKDGQLITE